MSREVQWNPVYGNRFELKSEQRGQQAGAEPRAQGGSGEGSAHVKNRDEPRFTVSGEGMNRPGSRNVAQRR